MLAEVVELHAELDLTKGSATGERVSGSRTPPLPLRVDPLDLGMPARIQSVHDPYGDQVGEISIASTLDLWARDWQTHWWATLPPPTVDNLAQWLLERLDDACNLHGAIDDFAFELNDRLRRLRPRAPRPELKTNVPCPRCEHAALYRMPGSDRIECGTCPALLTMDEYERWVGLCAAPEYMPWVREVLRAAEASSVSGP